MSKYTMPGLAGTLLLVALATGQAARAAGGELNEIAADAAQRCRAVGDVAGSDAMFVGLMAKKGSQRAKAKASKQGLDLGADSVVWSQRGTSMTNEWTGKAYACGVSAPAARASAGVPSGGSGGASAGAIREVGSDAVARCRELGAVAGSDAMFVGLMAKKGSQRAKAKALQQAGDLGADTVAWSQQGTSMTNEWTGTAYACGVSAATVGGKKASKGGRPAADAGDAAPSASAPAPGEVREAMASAVGRCKAVADIAGSDAMFVGLMAKKGSQRAKAKALKQVADAGANTVVWSQQGTSMTNEWVGKAYRCP